MMIDEESCWNTEVSQLIVRESLKIVADTIFETLIQEDAHKPVLTADVWDSAFMSRHRVPMRWIFSNLPNPSGRTMALGLTQPLTEMSTRNLKKKPGGKGRPARRVDNIAAIC
jgi:hypothetical protein